MIAKLIDVTLIENQAEISIPPQPDRLSQPRESIFVHLKGRVAAAVSEGAAEHQLLPARFLLYVIEQSMTEARQQLPEIDIITAVHKNASLQDRLQPFYD